MPIDNGVWYTRIGLFNNLFRLSFTSTKKTQNSSFNVFTKIKSLLINVLKCFSFFLILTFVFSLVYFFLVFLLCNFKNVSYLSDRSNISLTFLTSYLFCFPGISNNKHYFQM